MRFINGLAGCKKACGAQELETDDECSVRIIDTADNVVCLRVGTQFDDGVRLTYEEALYISRLLKDAAERLNTKKDQPC